VLGPRLDGLGIDHHDHCIEAEAGKRDISGDGRRIGHAAGLDD
jgi:hypothetical protein